MCCRRHPALRGIALAPLLAALLLLAASAGCGKKGPPLPPLRFIPAPTRDLSIHQQGLVLIFRFSYPSTTVSGQALPGVDAVQIWELVMAVPDAESLPEIDPQLFAQAAQPLVSLQGPELESSIVGDQVEARLPLSEPLPERELHVFAVRTVSASQEVSSFSNTVQLLLRPAIVPPRGLVATARADGVELGWSDEAAEAVGYHVYRRRSEVRVYGDPIERLEPGADRFLDTSAEYGRRYIYTVRALSSLEPLVESAPAGEREVDYEDRFAPAPPRGLLALAERGRIRLVWEASPDADTVGYQVYRRDPGASWRQVTSVPVAGLEYLDPGLAPGVTFEYRATAVDDVGNEGEPSPSAAATVL